MKEIVCHFCDGKEFITMKQHKGYAGLLLLNKILATGLEVHHEVCKNCGTIVRSYVVDLDKLK